MKNKITPQQNQSNMQNANKRTNGVNKQYAQNQGNRGKQLNPNQNKNILKIKPLNYIRFVFFWQLQNHFKSFGTLVKQKQISRDAKFIFVI